MLGSRKRPTEDRITTYRGRIFDLARINDDLSRTNLRPIEDKKDCERAEAVGWRGPKGFNRFLFKGLKE